MSRLGRLVAASAIVSASLVGGLGATAGAAADDNDPAGSAGAVVDDAEQPGTADTPIGAGGLVGSGNEFWPESANIGDCVGLLERPGCGSEGRGGWRQGLTFGVVVAGLALIGTRIVFAVRRRNSVT